MSAGKTFIGTLGTFAVINFQVHERSAQENTEGVRNRYRLMSGLKCTS